MTNLAKKYNLWGEVLMSFVMGFTSPSIHFYFMRLVHPKVYSFVVLLGTFFTAVIMRSLQNEGFKAKVFSWFRFVVFMDNIGFFVVALGLVHYPNARFIGMCFFNTITTGYWMALMTAAFNDRIHGDELTDFTFKKREWNQWGALLGSVGSMIIATEMTEWHIFCLTFMQCLANLTMSITDWKAFKMLRSCPSESLAS